MNVKETVTDFDNLYRAMKLCKRTVIWKDSVANYCYNGIMRCSRLSDSLRNGSYKLQNYIIFTINEPKERVIVSTRFNDRVFQRSLCDNYLYDEITKGFIYDSGACQKGKGTLFSRKRFKAHLQQFYRENGTNGYMLRCDIKDYFGSTEHDVASQAVHNRVDDEWVCNQVDTIINSFDRGMGLGSQVTQLVELSVLDDLDHYIKEKLHIKHYVRYMDDFILVHTDKEHLKFCLEKIKEKLAKIKLRLHDKKTFIQPITQPIRYLGFNYRLTETGYVVIKIPKDKIKHEKKKLKRQVNRAKQGIMAKAQVDDCYQSYRAYIQFGDNHRVILELDKYYKDLWRSDNEISQRKRNGEPSSSGERKAQST